MTADQRSYVSLGHVLIELGIINQEQFNEAWAAAEGSENKLPDALIKQGVVEEAQIIKAIGIKNQAPYFDSLENLIDEEAAKLLPEKICRTHLVVPMFKEGESLMVAMLNPYDIFTIDIIAQYTGLDVQPVVSTRKAIFSAVSNLFSNKDKTQIQAQMQQAVEDIGLQVSDNAAAAVADAAAGVVPETDSEVSAEDAAAHQARGIRLDSSQAGEIPLVKLVDKMIHEAIRSKATDIHVEPGAKRLIIRYRMDGMLVPVLNLPLDMAPAVASRLKIMAKLDISETRLPQDGHIQFEYDTRIVDLRVSTLPTVTGEKIVMRVLDSEGLVMTLDDLGFPPDIRANIDKIIASPNGVFLVTGPTGSGKTTTLYTILNKLKEPTKNISTMEDPVEYQVDGLNQIQVVPRIGMTFAKGLRALLRQDPDIILVGEIRDSETATIAVHAALTGHFLLSTLHTNDATSALMRLINMEVEPYLVAGTVRGVLAQRLIRKLCPYCRVEYAADKDTLALLGLPADQEQTLFKSAGCTDCAFTGYRGRCGVYELLVVTPRIQALVLAGKSDIEINEAAREGGFRNMRELGLEKVLSGETSAEELIRIAGGSQ